MRIIFAMMTALAMTLALSGCAVYEWRYAKFPGKTPSERLDVARAICNGEATEVVHTPRTYDPCAIRNSSGECEGGYTAAYDTRTFNEARFKGCMARHGWNAYQVRIEPTE